MHRLRSTSLISRCRSYICHRWKRRPRSQFLQRISILTDIRTSRNYATHEISAIWSSRRCICIIGGYDTVTSSYLSLVSHPLSSREYVTCCLCLLFLNRFDSIFLHLNLSLHRWEIMPHMPTPRFRGAAVRMSIYGFLVVSGTNRENQAGMIDTELLL